MKPARLRVLTLLAVLVLALAGCIRPISGTGKTIEPHKKKEEKLGKSIAGKEWCEKKENNLS